MVGYLKEGCEILKLSTKGEYGLRAMFELAKYYGDGPIPLKIVAQKQELSEPYLEQLLGLLRKGGLIDSVRGAQGGYILAKSPNEIQIGEIIRILEGPILPVDCVNDEKNINCSRFYECAARHVWEKVKVSIIDVLDSMTLGNILREMQSVRSNNSDNSSLGGNKNE